MTMRNKLHGVEHRYLPLDKPIEVVAASTIALTATADDADADHFPLNTPVLVSQPDDIAQAGTRGTLANALNDIYAQQPTLVIVVRVAEADTETGTTAEQQGAQVAHLIGTVDNETNTFTGMQAILNAEATLGMIPRLFICPGFSQIEAVGTALEALAKKLRGMAIIDGQSDGLSAAIQDKNRYDEVLFVDNGIRLFDTDSQAYITREASASVAGHIVRIDYAHGYWHSPSNHRLYGITGPGVSVDYTRGSKTCLANVLSANDIGTVINKEGGPVFWGNRLANGMLIPHQRLRYLVGDSIMAAHEEYVDRNLTTSYYEFMIDRVNRFIRRLTLAGKIAGGECWLNAELNKAAAEANTAYFDYKLGFFNVAETLVFRQHVTAEYNNQIIDRIAT